MWPRADGPPPPAPRRELKKGDSGPDVELLQAALGIPPDGEFGAVTDAGVQRISMRLRPGGRRRGRPGDMGEDRRAGAADGDRQRRPVRGAQARHHRARADASDPALRLGRPRPLPVRLYRRHGPMLCPGAEVVGGARSGGDRDGAGGGRCRRGRARLVRSRNSPSSACPTPCPVSTRCAACSP